MIPAFVDIGSPWKVLPPGIHDATLREIETRFATSEQRRRLFSGFRKGIKALCRAGCREVFLDGSFVTAKPLPGDFDACWNPMGVDYAKLDPVLLDFSSNRKKQKACFHGEFFPASSIADGSNCFLDFFQADRHTGKAKGLIRLHFPRSTGRKGRTRS